MDISRFNGSPPTPMSVHSYSRCWLHLIWETLNREELLNKEAAARLSRYLTEYADTKHVYMKINYVNADHVHALVDLPTNLSIELPTTLQSRFSKITSSSNPAPPRSSPQFRCESLVPARVRICSNAKSAAAAPPAFLIPRFSPDRPRRHEN